MLYNTAGEVTAQWLATMAASHWRARQAFTPRTYGHNSLISGLIQSVFADRVDSGAADPASRSPICITEESTIRASLLKSPWSDLWFPLIVSDTVPLFKAALWSMTVQLARGGTKGTLFYCLYGLFFSRSAQRKVFKSTTFSPYRSATRLAEQMLAINCKTVVTLLMRYMWHTQI